MQALRSRTSFGSSDRMTLPTQSPYRSESLDGFGRKKSSRAPLVVGGLLAVLLLCVCAYLFLGGDGNEHVPVAAYSQQPSKRDPTVLKKKEETTPGTHILLEDNCRILAFGDSLTKGYTGYKRKLAPYTNVLQWRLDEMYGKATCKVINAGQNGELTSTMSTRLPRLLNAVTRTKRPYSHIVILGGMNDLQRETAETIFHNLENIHATANRHGAKVIGLTIPELKYEKNDPPIAELRKTVNERMMKGIPDTTWIDLAAAIPQSGTEEAQQYWSPDGLHFSQYGYSEVSSLVFDALVGMMHAKVAQKDERL